MTGQSRTQDDAETKQRVKETEKHLAEAKQRNTGVRPAGRKDVAEETGRRERLPNPGQTIVNTDQSDG